MSILSLLEEINFFNRIDGMKTIDGVDQDIKKLNKKEIIYPSGSNIIFILGGPGTGKGTQCKRIVENLCYVSLSIEAF